MQCSHSYRAQSAFYIYPISVVFGNHRRRRWAQSPLPLPVSGRAMLIMGVIALLYGLFSMSLKYACSFHIAEYVFHRASSRPAKNARSLIASQSIGTLASVYPSAPSRSQNFYTFSPTSEEFESHHHHTEASRPAPNFYYDLSAHAFALPEYYAPCYPSNGSLLLIMFRISQNARNILGDWESSSRVELDSVDSGLSGGGLWGDAGELKQITMKEEEGEGNGARLAAIKWKQSGQATFIVQELPLSPSPVTRPRVALIGNLTLISDVWSRNTCKSHRHILFPIPIQVSFSFRCRLDSKYCGR